MLAIGGGHVGREAFVQPEFGPRMTRDHVAPPLMGELVSDEPDGRGIGYHGAAVRLGEN